MGGGGAPYRTYMKLEKRLAENTVAGLHARPEAVRPLHPAAVRRPARQGRRGDDPALHGVVSTTAGREKSSQARALCGVRSFYNFLMLNDRVESSPAEFIPAPRRRAAASRRAHDRGDRPHHVRMDPTDDLATECGKQVNCPEGIQHLVSGIRRRYGLSKAQQHIW